MWDWIGGGLSVALAVIGVIYAYARNGGRHGFDLIQKYVFIGWIVAVRCFLVFIPCALVLYVIGDRLGYLTVDTNCYDTLIFVGFEAVLYERIGRHIADTR